MQCTVCNNLEQELKVRRITKEQYVRKLDIHHHEETQANLKEQISQLNSQLALLQKQFGDANTELQSLSGKKEMIQIELEASQKQLGSLDKSATVAIQNLRQAELSHESLKIKMADEHRNHSAAIINLSTKITTLTSEINGLGNVIDELNMLKLEKEDLLIQVNELQGKQHDVEQETARLYAKLSDKEKEVNALIEKNSKICTQSEVNLGRLEIYVRRLQRYYQESGIRMNILPSFGLSPEVIAQTNVGK